MSHDIMGDLIRPHGHCLIDIIGLLDMYTKFQLSWLSLKVQRSLLSSKPSWLELWKTLEFPDWGFIIQCILKKAYNVQ